MHLYDYLTQQLENGKSDEEIRNLLVERGYSLDKVLRLVESAHIINDQKRPNLKFISLGGIFFCFDYNDIFITDVA